MDESAVVQVARVALVSTGNNGTRGSGGKYSNPNQGWASKLKHRAKVVKEHSTVEPMPIHSIDNHPPPPKNKPHFVKCCRKHFHVKHFLGTANLLNSG